MLNYDTYFMEISVYFFKSEPYNSCSSSNSIMIPPNLGASTYFLCKLVTTNSFFIGIWSLSLKCSNIRLYDIFGYWFYLKIALTSKVSPFFSISCNLGLSFFLILCNLTWANYFLVLRASSSYSVSSYGLPFIFSNYSAYQFNNRLFLSSSWGSMLFLIVFNCLL